MNLIAKAIEKDCIVREKVRTCGCTEEQIDRAYNMIIEFEGIEGGLVDVTSMHFGVRPSFLIKTVSQQYVIHLPRSGDNWKKYNRYRSLLGLNNPFEITESDDGILLEYLAINQFIWTEPIIKELLTKLSLIHKRVDIIDHFQHISDYLDDCEEKCITKCKIPKDLFDEMHSIIRDYHYCFEPVLCHGDLNSKNILLWGDDSTCLHPYIIDWEQICMGDPYYDLAKLYVSVVWSENTSVADPYKWLQIYLSRFPYADEISRFNYMILCFYYAAVLHEIRCQNCVDGMIMKLLELLRYFKAKRDCRFEGGRL